MQFLSLYTPSAAPSGPPAPEHMEKMGKYMMESFANGSLVATGALLTRDPHAITVSLKNGDVSVADGAKGAADWMAASGFAILNAPDRKALAKMLQEFLELAGDGTSEAIQLMDMPPPPPAAAGPHGAPPQQGVIPYLTIDGAAEAAAFYKKAFGATEAARMPAEDGKRLMHCHLVINGGSLMLADGFPEYGHPAVPQTVVMQLVIEDGETWWNRAIAAGCKEKMPFNVAPWGDRYGQMTDPFGITWGFNQPAKR
ncbi:hypothetical protein sos41_18520 [Alphaproteobacteria bacterium SO-S41]|nr:hypothetical protein sos41_18520 [Alphaproteobacteria bacterium SO-S41]